MINMNEIKQAAIESLNDYSLKQILNSAPNMIHEKDYKELNCVLCNKLMKTVYDTHCAFPLAKLQSAKEAFKNPENHSRCCSVCNRDVMAERFKMMCGYRKKNKSNRPINEPLEKIKIEMTSIPINEPLEKIKIEMTSIEELGKIKSFYETPQAQKRFKELGQNYYETDLGRSELERRNDESSFSTKKGK